MKRRAQNAAAVEIPDFGHDLSCADDLEDDMREVSGIELLAQAIYRRLYTPRGALWQDPHYGLDLRLYMSRAMSPAEIAALPGEVVAEIRKDERVGAATVSIIKLTLFEIEIAINVTAASGPFSLVISATQAAVTLASVLPAGGA